MRAAAVRRLIVCCGPDGERCGARIATLSGDGRLREETVRKWRAMNRAPEIAAAAIDRTGCRTAGAKSKKTTTR